MEDLSPADLRAKAHRYRSMMLQAADLQVIEALKTLASEFDALAARLESTGDSERFD